MGLFGDKDMKRLDKVLSECRLVFEMSERMPGQMAVDGMNRAGSELAAALEPLANGGRASEARVALEAARTPSPCSDKALWHKLIDPLVEQLREIEAELA